MFCPKCGTKLEENYNCCPVCQRSTLNEQIIIRNADKQGCFGFFSGCITGPIKIILIFMALGFIGGLFKELNNYKAILIPLAIIAVIVFKWDWIKNKFQNIK